MIGRLLLLLLFIRVYHISVSWWFINGVWITAVSSSLQDSFRDSGRSQQCCHLDVPPTSTFSRPFNNPLLLFLNNQLQLTQSFLSCFTTFFNSLARSKYLSSFSLSFKIILWSAGTAKLTILQILVFLLIIIRSGLLAGIRWSVCILKSHRSLCVSYYYYYYYYYFAFHVPFFIFFFIIPLFFCVYLFFHFFFTFLLFFLFFSLSYSFNQ